MYILLKNVLFQLFYGLKVGLNLQRCDLVVCLCSSLQSLVEVGTCKGTSWFLILGQMCNVSLKLDKSHQHYTVWASSLQEKHQTSPKLVGGEGCRGDDRRRKHLGRRSQEARSKEAALHASSWSRSPREITRSPSKGEPREPSTPTWFEYTEVAQLILLFGFGLILEVASSFIHRVANKGYAS